MALSSLLILAIIFLLSLLFAVEALLYLIRWYETANRTNEAELTMTRAIFARRMRPLRTFIREYFYVAIYGISYAISFPFSFLPSAHEGKAPLAKVNPEKRLVILIHGVFALPGILWFMRLTFRLKGIENVVTFGYSPFDRQFFHHHQRLRDLVLRYRAEAGSEKVILVGHSYGGIISLDYDKEYGDGHLLGIVALGTPFRGSRLAVLALTPLARSLTPWHPRFGPLNTRKPGPPLYSIYSRYDQLVLPYTNSEHPHAASNELIESCGHSGLMFDRKALWLAADHVKKLALAP